MRLPAVESVGPRRLVSRLLIVAILAPLSGCSSLRAMPGGVSFAAPIIGGDKTTFDPPGSVFRQGPDGVETGQGHAPFAGIDGSRVEAPKAKEAHTWQTVGNNSQKNGIYMDAVLGGIIGGGLGFLLCEASGSSSFLEPSSWGCAGAGALLGMGIGAILTKSPHRGLPFEVGESPDLWWFRPWLRVVHRVLPFGVAEGPDLIRPWLRVGAEDPDPWSVGPWLRRVVGKDSLTLSLP